MILSKWLLPLAFVSAALGQNTQVGGFIGYGGAAKLFEDSSYLVVGGAEACVLCGGRTGFFLEYQHWGATGNRFSGNPRSLDLVGGGFRVQGKGSRVRPFFDVGLMGGRERNDLRTIPPRIESKGVLAGILGFGAAISVTERVYIRPMIRVGALSSPQAAGFFAVAAGYRF